MPPLVLCPTSVTKSHKENFLIDSNTNHKVVVITGASDGIGGTAARLLHQRGHEVVVVGRSPQKTAAVAAELGAAHLIADFTRLDDVRELAANLDAKYPRIDVLANNAGGVFGDPTRTVDGFEKTFQINHLATFLLTSMLKDKLIASRARVIQTTTLHGGNVKELNLDELSDEGDLDPIRHTTLRSFTMCCSPRNSTAATTPGACQPPCSIPASSGRTSAPRPRAR